MTRPAGNLRYRIFSALAHFDVHRPWLVIVLSMVLAAVCVFYTRARLEFRTGQDDLISANNRDSRNYLRYTKEFPDLDVTVRGAISIARRLQDPLAELVKIDPKSIGVGQYQHDVSENALKKSLDLVVDSCVNQVGVDLNTASPTLVRPMILSPR